MSFFANMLILIYKSYFYKRGLFSYRFNTNKDIYIYVPGLGVDKLIIICNFIDARIFKHPPPKPPLQYSL